VATLMLEGGADIRYIQAMLGHAHLNTTQVYTHVGIRALQQVHAMTHPAGLLKRPEPPAGAGFASPGANGGAHKDDLPDVLVEDPTSKELVHPPPPPPSDADRQALAAALVDDEDDDTSDTESVVSAADNGNADDG
jgi:hypothetical protein